MRVLLGSSGELLLGGEMGARSDRKGMSGALDWACKVAVYCEIAARVEIPGMSGVWVLKETPRAASCDESLQRLRNLVTHLPNPILAQSAEAKAAVPKVASEPKDLGAHGGQTTRTFSHGRKQIPALSPAEHLRNLCRESNHTYLRNFCGQSMCTPCVTSARRPCSRCASLTHQVLKQ